jgi:pimeloyl-ACP methyl ester carboxylesterase
LQSFDALAGGQPTLIDAVGIGAGGQLLLRLASALQDRFRRIVAVAVDASAMPAAADGAADGADGVWRTDPAHDSQDSAVAAFRAGALRPLEPRMLARVIAACRLIVGEQDDVGPLLAELPDADVQRLAGFDRSHAPFDERVIDAAAHFVVDGV